ncbi:MAG: transporter substrate-binding domain-containing protein [Thermoflexales bacterium]|nr:transporter substrate-binding domain-containing protein [Thermoflexales bacterium]
MRRWLFGFAVASLLLSSACSILERFGDVVQPEDVSEGVLLEPQVTPIPPEVSTAALVKRRGILLVGIRYDTPPLVRVNAEGELEGFDIDLARELARRWLGSPRNVDFVQVTSRTAPRLLRERALDLAMGGLVHTRDGELDADYSMTLLIDGEALLTRAGAFPNFTSMARRTVDYIDAASTFALRDAQIAGNITVSLRGQNSYRAAIDDLLAGETDGVVGRWRRLRATAAGNPALQVLTVFTQEPVAIALPPDDSAWANLVNVTLSAMIADGTFAALYTRWFGEAPFGMRPLSALPSLRLVDLPDVKVLRDPLKALRSNNVVRVAYVDRASPLVAVSAQGVPTGYEVELVREMARRWLDNPNAVQLIPSAVGELPALLAQGGADLAIGALAHTAQSELDMDFSQTTFLSGETPLAIALPENASAWRDLVNLTLQEMLDDGTWQRIYQRWFPDQSFAWVERWSGRTPDSRALFESLGR